MPDLRERDVIICLRCRWNGEVSDLKPVPVSSTEEDAIDFMRCPDCNEALAIRGCTDFILIPRNAETRVFKTAKKMENLWRNFHVVCLRCHWNGQASDLKDGELVREGKHSAYSLRCPKCNENLAMCSRVDFRAIAGKAIVRGAE